MESLITYHKNAYVDLNAVKPCHRLYIPPLITPVTHDNIDNRMDYVGVWMGSDTSEDTGLKPPPRFTRLSEPFVFEMYHRASVNQRACHPRDLGQNGEVRAQRLPAGPAVISYIFGIPFVAVFNASVMLAGASQNWSSFQ